MSPNPDPLTPCSVFHGPQLIARGALSEMASVVISKYSEAQQSLVVINDQSGAVIDIAPQGWSDLAQKAAQTGPNDLVRSLRTKPPQTTHGQSEKRGRGRPKLGVVGREVTLLPRHWDWLGKQPGGASVALRKLVETARQSGETEKRAAREAAYRAMNTLGGDLPGYEEAIRALFAGDIAAMDNHIAEWPEDLRAFIGEFAQRCA